jgi:hypothetical protein
LVTVLWSLYFLTEVVNAKSKFDGGPPAARDNKTLLMVRLGAILGTNSRRVWSQFYLTNPSLGI